MDIRYDAGHQEHIRYLLLGVVELCEAKTFLKKKQAIEGLQAVTGVLERMVNTSSNFRVFEPEDLAELFEQMATTVRHDAACVEADRG